MQEEDEKEMAAETAENMRLDSVRVCAHASASAHTRSYMSMHADPS